jgi:acetyltransferase
LDAFFNPRSVAVIGATETPASVGRTVFENLLSGRGPGAVFPINPKRSTVLGVRAYPTVGTAPGPTDLAVIVTPATTVPEVISECADAGVAGAIIISAGFKEVGETGAQLERDILDRARRGNLRLIGPNCLGIMNPRSRLNATFASTIAPPGRIAFLSQSGAICTAILDWSQAENVGFSAFVSLGSMLDVGWADLIDYLGDDPDTSSIIMYMESVGDARSFLSAAREVALGKPLIVIKAGRSAEGAKAAASHTGALTGRDEVLDAAFRRCGVLRVSSIAELFDLAEALGKQPLPSGPRLTIVTNAGGLGVLATDALVAAGGRLAELSAESIKALNELLPPHWSHGNPIDVLGDASPERYAGALRIAASDPASDGLLAVLAPQGMSAPEDVARHVVASSQGRGKTILASWTGGRQVAAGVDVLNQAGVPTFTYPDGAARTFTLMWRYRRDLQALYQTPAPTADPGAVDQGATERILGAARTSGRTLLTESESKAFLRACGIPIVPTVAATSEDDAAREAARLGYPVVVKLLSETVTHKARVGGVVLDLRGEAEVRSAYRAIQAAVREQVGEGHFQGVTVQPMVRSAGHELIVGSSFDPQFGPVLLFGAGGSLVEILGDRALGLPPLNTTLAQQMIDQTRISRALTPDEPRLAELLVRFSWMVVEQRRIKEIDINPLLVSPDGLVALDARIVLHSWDIGDADLPTSAIRPYPTRYVAPFTLRDGSSVTIRPIRPEDEPLMVELHRSLSPESVHSRYFGGLSLSDRVDHRRLVRNCFIDYDRAMALVAVRSDPAAADRIVAVGRLARLPGTRAAEFAVLVTDEWQGRGLGTELLSRLLAIGRDEKLTRIEGEVLPENRRMLATCRRLGFSLGTSLGEGVVKAEIGLEPLDPTTSPGFHETFPKPAVP